MQVAYTYDYVRIFGSIMLLTNLKVQSLTTLVVCFAACIPLTWQFVLVDYQKERALSFWSSFTDPERDMLDSGWHAYQSKVAIGSGSGPGTSRRMRSFVPGLPAGCAALLCCR